MMREVHLLKELHPLRGEEEELPDKATQTRDRHQAEDAAMDHSITTAKTQGNFKEMGVGCRLRSSKAILNKDYRQ